MLTSREKNDARIREGWMPDPEVWQFIHECLEKRFNVDAARLDERWIPLGIVGTLMWIEVTGWWIVENSGITATGEQFDTAHVYDGGELDPAGLLVLRYLEDKAKEYLKVRWDDPGLNGDEKGEILGFLRRCVYENSDVPVPPLEILISIVWGTMVWSLTQKGRNWVQRLDAMFDCTVSMGVSYKATDEAYPEGELLDPSLVDDTERGLGVCSKCHSKLWCVKSHCHQGEMWSLCYNCMKSEGDKINYGWITWQETANTMCDFDVQKENLDCASCRCPHAVEGAEQKRDAYTLGKMKTRGSQRLLEFEEAAKRVGGVFGKRPEELVSYFKGV